jgi:hypothetical protein
VTVRPDKSQVLNIHDEYNDVLKDEERVLPRARAGTAAVDVQALRTRANSDLVRASEPDVLDYDTLARSAITSLVSDLRHPRREKGRTRGCSGSSGRLGCRIM